MDGCLKLEVVFSNLEARRPRSANSRHLFGRVACFRSSSRHIPTPNTKTTLHDGLYSIISLQHNTMASGAQAHLSIPPRSTFATSTKLPDRAGLNNPQFGQPAPIQQFGQTIPRRNEGQVQFGLNQAGPQPPQHAQQGRPQQEKTRNYLNDLSEEQREEINEAVCRCPRRMKQIHANNALVQPV